MKKIFLMALSLCAVAASAQTYKETPEVAPKVSIRPNMTVLLYPKGQAAGQGIVEKGIKITQGPQEDNGLRGPETCSKGGSRGNIGDEARMDIYLAKKPNGQMVVMTPGGGYIHVSSFNEGSNGAKWLTDRGISVCVLKYRLPNGHKTVPLDDVQNAFRYCRYHAKDWGIRQIGVMGGSAGGHLAACCATMWTDSITRPDFAVLYYPRITLRRGEYCDTKENLLGKDSTWNNNIDEHLRLLQYYSPDTHINKQTPPVFIALSADDNSVPPTNMIPFYTQLINYGIKTELHVYPKGGHGWGFTTVDIAGKDKLGKYRAEFSQSLQRWLGERLAEAK